MLGVLFARIGGRMGDETKDSLEPALREMCWGHAGATEFCLLLLQMMSVYDDLIDGDFVPAKDLHMAFEIGLLHLPRNPFYRQQFDALAPYIISAIRNWRIANELEDRNETSEDLRIAFVLRSSYVDVFTTVALLLHGKEEAIDWGVKLRRAVADETYVAYKREMESR